MIPIDKNGNISPMYADRYTDTYYKKKYGEKLGKMHVLRLEQNIILVLMQ